MTYYVILTCIMMLVNIIWLFTNFNNSYEKYANHNKLQLERDNTKQGRQFDQGLFRYIGSMGLRQTAGFLQSLFKYFLQFFKGKRPCFDPKLNQPSQF